MDKKKLQEKIKEVIKENSPRGERLRRYFKK